MRDDDISRILRLLDPATSLEACLVSRQWRRCFKLVWRGGALLRRSRSGPFDGIPGNAEWMARSIDITQYLNVHTVNISHGISLRDEDIPYLANAASVSLAGCTSIHDVSPLCDVHTLDLSACIGVSVESISRLHNVRDLDLGSLVTISHLGGVDSLESLSSLSCLETLCILQSDISDISALAKITTLQSVRLMYCTNLVNVDSLSHVDCIYLTGCHRIIDVAALKYCKELHIDYCREITTSMEHLRGIEKLVLGSSVTDLSPFNHRNTRTRCLTLQSNLQDFSPLARLHTVRIQDCLVTDEDVLPLAFVKKLSITSCSLLTGVSISRLVGVRKLALSDCSGVCEIDTRQFIHLKRLSLFYCSSFVDVSRIHRVCSLSISGSHRLADISTLDSSVKHFSFFGPYFADPTPSFAEQVNVLQRRGIHAATFGVN